MKHLLNGLAVAAVLAIAAPGWAQTSPPSSPPPAPSAPPSAAPAETPPPAAAPAPAAPAPAAEAPPAARHARTTAHHHPRGARGHVVHPTAMHHHPAHHGKHHRAAEHHVRHHPMHHGMAMHERHMRGPASDNMANQLNREELNRIQGSSAPPGGMPPAPPSGMPQR